MEDAGVNAAILERLERVVESLQDNSVKMGQLLAVHNETVSYTHLTLPTICSV